ncbi:hypothetical protein ABH926_003573 [Catenulispora sp. GP43]|uniref:cellulose-binding domain-containing protein n=1 Tax=Catenulispora sp. GP43 TaxID=3156263 RepID=UPI00351899A4
MYVRSIRTLALVAAAVLALSAMFVFGSKPAEGAGTGCTVAYQVNQWSAGFTADVTVTNNGPALSAWTATWSWSGNQQVTSAWNAQVSQSGQQVSAASEPYNGSVAAGATVGFGFQATYSGANGAPADFAFNGVPCSGIGTPSSPSSSPPTSPTLPSTSPPTSPSSQPSSGPCPASAVFCDGFENQTSNVPSGRWSVVTPSCSWTGTAAITTAQAHSGLKSLEIDGHGTYCDHVFAADSTDMPAAAPTWYVRFWMKHTAPLPTNHTTFLAMNDSAHGNTDLRLGAQNGALMWNRQSDDATLPDQSPAGVAQSVVFPTGTWECLEFSVDGTSGQIHTWYDGSPVAGLTEDGVSTPDVDDQWLSGSGASWRPQLTDLKLGWEDYSAGDDTLWFDDVVLSTSRIGC